MAENSSIEWTDHTFNAWEGCTVVSPACDHCYAEVRNKRFNGGKNWGAKANRLGRSEGYWRQPYKWDLKAKINGRAKVFCSSLSDVFDNHKSIKQEWRDRLWKTIRETPNLDWQLLTKRPQNIKKYLPDDWGDGYDNVWLGVTVENQEEANRRIPILHSVSCKLRFLSCEPLLGELDLEYPEAIFPDGPEHCCSGHECGCMGRPTEPPLIYGIDWVIAGGESGPNSRPTNPKWFDILKSDCENWKIPFFFKQWGDWFPYGGIDAEGNQNSVTKGEKIGFWHEWPNGFSVKIGKKKAGSIIDGKTYNQFPKQNRA